MVFILSTIVQFSIWRIVTNKIISGHAATSIGLLAYLLLECFVYHPNVLCGLTCQRRGRGEGGCAYSFQLGYGWQKQSNDENDSSGGPNDIVDDSVAIDINEGEASSTNMAANEASTTSPQPLLDKKEESHVQSSATSTTSPPSPMIAFFRGKWLQHWCALGYIILLVPVPLSRVYLHDHLRNQVGYGALIGIAASMIWYLIFVRTCGARVLRWRMSEWGKWWGLSLWYNTNDSSYVERSGGEYREYSSRKQPKDMNMEVGPWRNSSGWYDMHPDMPLPWTLDTHVHSVHIRATNTNSWQIV